eukprot:TRINITY_DN6346_c0_g1_i2.p1 TRINITY_DN6346_c0_g1~~TRINITY_DN6346_c0_g1_i2.p1  ORF type:complete len:378 (-),score=55.29 TRINITY_DN6346_c0_g1_i2:40-1173(-)
MEQLSRSRERELEAVWKARWRSLERDWQSKSPEPDQISKQHGGSDNDLQDHLRNSVSDQTQQGIKAGLVRTMMQGTVSPQTQQEIKSGLVRSMMQGTVSPQTQQEIKSGLVRSMMQGTVKPQTQQEIKSGLVRSMMHGPVKPQTQESINSSLTHSMRAAASEPSSAQELPGIPQELLLEDLLASRRALFREVKAQAQVPAEPRPARPKKVSAHAEQNIQSKLQHSVSAEVQGLIRSALGGGSVQDATGEHVKRRLGEMGGPVLRSRSVPRSRALAHSTQQEMNRIMPRTEERIRIQSTSTRRSTSVTRTTSVSQAPGRPRVPPPVQQPVQHPAPQPLQRPLHQPLSPVPVSYTHLRDHETVLEIVCHLLLETKLHHI